MIRWSMRLTSASSLSHHISRSCSQRSLVLITSCHVSSGFFILKCLSSCNGSPFSFFTFTYAWLRTVPPVLGVHLCTLVVVRPCFSSLLRHGAMHWVAADPSPAVFFGATVLEANACPSFSSPVKNVIHVGICTAHVAPSHLFGCKNRGS